jgi:hypothetical protein
MAIHIRRREFIATLGGAAAWPPAAGGQQIDRVRRLGFFDTGAESDPEAQNWINALTHHLERQLACVTLLKSGETPDLIHCHGFRILCVSCRARHLSASMPTHWYSWGWKWP